MNNRNNENILSSVMNFLPRPNTGSYENRTNMSSSSRPSTAGLTRPGTSSGRKHLGQSTSSIYQGPAISSSHNDILVEELGNDSLLRIRNEDSFKLNNEALMLSESGNLEGLLEVIRNKGFDISKCKGLNGFTPLHHACNRGHALIVAELLKLNLPIDCQNDNEETPLHLAVYAGNILIVDQLLDKGANINARNVEKETCLFYAARRAMPAIIRLLIQRGINTDMEDKYGDKAIDHATDTHTIKSFDIRPYSGINNNQKDHVNIEKSGYLRYIDLLEIFSYLELNDILRCACVSTKFHRASEFEGIWKKFGVRRWELALRNSLGFGLTATNSFSRPTSKKVVKSSVTTSQKEKSGKLSTVSKKSIK